MASEKREVVIAREKTGSKEYVEIVDAKTGELVGSFWKAYIKKPPGRPQAKSPRVSRVQFCKVYTTNWNDIIDKKSLSLTEIGFFMSLMRFVNWESNFLVHPRTKQNLNASSIAELLKIDRGSVFIYLERLNKKGMLCVVKCGDGYPNHYILNSNILFRGNKIKDMSEHRRFLEDCPYQPPVAIKYVEKFKAE